MKQTIYKIFRTGEWQEFEDNGHYAGSADDRRDGYIHLSAGPQLRGTLDKYFSSEPQIIIAAIDEGGLDGLRWEASSGGDLFPHYYGILLRSDVHAHWEIFNGEHGFTVPDLIEKPAHA